MLGAGQGVGISVDGHEADSSHAVPDRFIAGEPTMAAFYCTVEDARVATIELDTVEGHRWRADVRGRRAVIFPYVWDMQSKWPTQQPRTIRLFGAAGQALNLPTSPLAGERR